MSKIKTKVLTTTNQQDLSGVQAQNARTNIGAQVKLTTDDASAIILTDIHEDDDPSKPIVAQRIDANVSAYHSGDDGKYITVDNTKNEIDLSESAKRKIGTKSDWTAPEGTDGEILHKPDIPAKANNGKLTINYINREGEKSTKVFYADSAEDIVLNISDTDTTYEPATQYKDGLLSATDKAKLTTLTKPNDGKLTIRFTNANGTVKQSSFSADASSDTIVDITDTNTTYENATLTADGLMSKEDKAKLENVIAPNDGKLLLRFIKADGTVEEQDFSANSDKNVVFTVTAYPCDIATPEKDGLMSKEDKEKLDSITDKMQSDWAEESELSSSYIKNKPSIYTQSVIDEKFAAVDSKMHARAKFGYATVDELPEEGDSASMYYVGPKAGVTPDAYDVYEWNTTINQYVMVDSSSIKLDGYWHGAPTVEGTGNAITGITFDGANVVINKDTTFATESDLSAHIEDKDIHVTLDDKNKWDSYKPNEGTLVVKLAGATFDASFNANSATDVTIDIPLGTTMEPGLFSTADNVKLTEIEAGAEVNVQSDWDVADTASKAYIKNKPAINDGMFHLSLGGVTCDESFSANSATDVTIDIPLGSTMEPGLISIDDKAKLDKIPEDAEKNVQSDWNEINDESDAYIKNKPVINDGIMHLSLAGVTCEASFSANSAIDVTFDIPLGTTMEPGLFSTTDNMKLSEIESGAEVNVQSDWDETDANNDSFIKNKPSFIADAQVSEDGTVLTLTKSTGVSTTFSGITYDYGDGIDIDDSNVISVKIGAGLTFDDDGNINVTIDPPEYSEGNGISITEDTISVKVGAGLTFDESSNVALTQQVTQQLENMSSFLGNIKGGINSAVMEIIDDDTATEVQQGNTKLATSDLVAKAMAGITAISIQGAVTIAEFEAIGDTPNGHAYIITESGMVRDIDGTYINVLKNDMLVRTPNHWYNMGQDIDLSPYATKTEIPTFIDGIGTTVTSSVSPTGKMEYAINLTGVDPSAVSSLTITSNDDSIAVNKTIEESSINYDLSLAEESLPINPGEGIRFNQTSATSPLSIELAIPTVIEFDPTWTPTEADGKLHFVLMEET